MNIKGTGLALVTPFNDDYSIDYKSLQKLINHVITGGVEYIVALGTTAESATLSFKEKKDVLKSIINYTDNQIPVVVGIGGNNTKDVIDKCNALDLAGVSGILSVSPYYNKPSQEGIYAHYSALAKKTPLPLILYNVPGRTASNIEVKTTLKIAKKFNVVLGIKEASGNLEQCMAIINNKPDRFQLTSGDDSLALPLTYMGGVGVISVLGQAYPKEFSNMIRMGLNLSLGEANNIHYSLLNLINSIFIDGNPSGIKYLLSVLGICKNNLRLPLVEVSELTKSVIKKNML